jgi:hypothetical protein
METSMSGTDDSRTANSESNTSTTETAAQEESSAAKQRSESGTTTKGSSKKSASSKRAGKKVGSKKGGKKVAKGSNKSGNSAAQTSKHPRIFPAVTLEDALRIPEVIRTKNGANPWATDQVAEAVGYRQKSNEFFYLAGGAVNYGVSIGGWKADKIEISELGREILYAPDPSTEYSKKLQAFLNIEVFAKVLAHFKGSELPEMKYLSNTLEREFNIPPEQHDQFSRIFRANCEYLGIRSGFSFSIHEGRVISSQVPQQDLAVVSPTTVTLAEPTKETNLIAFVIMPFVERDASHSDGFFQEVLRILITPAARDAGFIVRTANRHGSDVIQSTIINDLLEADLVIADLTEHNPNVLFELGVRMGNDLPVCLIKASDTGQIFDVDNMLRVYTYNRNLWSTTIERDLPNITDHIKGAWETRNSETTYMKILRRGVVATSPNNFDAFPVSIRSNS